MGHHKPSLFVIRSCRWRTLPSTPPPPQPHRPIPPILPSAGCSGLQVAPFPIILTAAPLCCCCRSSQIIFTEQDTPAAISFPAAKKTSPVQCNDTDAFVFFKFFVCVHYTCDFILLPFSFTMSLSVHVFSCDCN